MNRSLTIIFWFSIGLWVPAAQGQKLAKSNPDVLENPAPVICYAQLKDQNTFLPPPAAYLKSKSNHAKTKTANIEVQYVNFSPEAQTAFQAAVEIWETLIESDVTIHIRASWQSLGTTVLGSASPALYRRNLPGVQRRQVWYPVALAEKIVGEDLNDPTSADIIAFFNSDFGSWYFGTDGATPSGKFDFLTVVLHEIGHGLGIVHGYTVVGSVGTISDFFGNSPVLFESFAENASNQNLVTDFSAPSSALKSQLESSTIFFSGPNANGNNGGVRPKLYAPSTFSSGSSIAHLDESQYPAGSPNSLMTPQIGFAESAHDPGPIVAGILKDLGWVRTLLKHDPLPNTEITGTPFNVTVKLISDVENEESTLTLYYRTNSQSNFSSVSLAPSGQPGEFQADIPSTGAAGAVEIYDYYVAVNDNFEIQRTNPGKNHFQGQPVSQAAFRFEAGPDSKQPKVSHEPKPFLRDGDTSFELDAVVTDNIGVQSVVVEWFVNEVPQPDAVMNLANAEDSLYSAAISFGTALVTDDIVKYRIKATDNSAAQNIGYFPLSEFIQLKAEGLSETRDSYTSNFNSANSDFFGNGFSITTPSGFNDAAIHSTHPYSEGNGFPNDELNFVYQLRIPIQVKAKGATIRFDEIALIEPGEDNSVFGGSDFYDYVVTEGSKDGGVTWVSIGDGYDARDDGTWLTRYTSGLDGNISTAMGDPTLFRPRELNLLEKFNPGDVVVIRFRLFSDPFAVGWGWAIDNLRIQVDENGPEILHNQIDYILSNHELLPINVKVSDDSKVESLSVQYQFSGGPEETYLFVVNESVDQYSLDLNLSAMQPGEELQYRIKATDEFGNETSLPENGNFSATYIDLSAGAPNFVSDFNEPSSDFSGGLFSVQQIGEFSNGLFGTSHDYSKGFGLDNTSDLIAMLKTPIIINADNPYISFDEIALLDPNDYLVLEASKDNGDTWVPLTEQYNSGSKNAWVRPWLDQLPGAPTMIRNRTLSLLESGDFAASEKVLIRFRLFTGKETTGWGWIMDNLSIQGPITAVETQNKPGFDVFPNPANDVLTIALPAEVGPLYLRITDLSGRDVFATHCDSCSAAASIDISGWASGIYVMRVAAGARHFVQKIAVRH